MVRVAKLCSVLHIREGNAASSNETISFAIKLIHDAIRVKADNRLQEFDLTLSQMRVLNLLARRQGEPMRQKEIEDSFHVTHPTMIGTLKRLEAKGFIQNTVNLRDRRMRDVKLTTKGEQVQSVIENRVRLMQQRMLEGLTEPEVSLLTELLDRVYRNICAN
jgi:MarR family multiple gene transcriptional regulator MgrA